MAGVRKKINILKRDRLRLIQTNLPNIVNKFSVSQVYQSVR